MIPPAPSSAGGPPAPPAVADTLLRVLSVEDDRDDSELGRRALVRAGFQLEWQRVETEPDFLAALHPALDLILSDFTMPGFSGLQALQLLRQRAWDIPFVIVSGTIGEEAAVQAMRLGASDYLRKERLAELPGTVVRAREQRRLREEHRQAERRLREQAALLDLAQDAIMVQEFASRRIVFWNKGAEQLYGWSREEAVGRDPAALFTTAELMGKISSALLSAGEWRGEVTHQARGGAELHVIAKATLLRGEAGEPSSVLAINTDVTEYKRLETQMYRAQRLESIGTLAGGVAHDLSNVLSPVLMSVPLLRMELPPAVKEELISTIEACAERGAAIVKQVLTFARGGLVGQTLLHPAYPLREVAKIAHGTFPKSIVFRTELAEGLWHLRGDSTQLQQVLLNLCVNARDAMPEGGTLTLRVENATVGPHTASTLHEARPGPCVLHTVTDTGTGIPPEALEHIFDPFFTTKAFGQGTGLGLATVAGIVKSHGGFIQLETRPEQGTSFRIYLPALLEEETGPGLGQERPAPSGHGELILLVDDEPGIRSVTAAALENRGYRVLAAAQGHEAIRLFAEHLTEFQLVITDLMMPQMDGLTLARALRCLRPGIPILISVGETEKSSGAELEALDIPAPLLKPYRAETLLAMLAQTLHPACPPPPRL